MSSLDGTVHHAADKVFLQEQEDHNHRQDGQQSGSRGGIDVAGGLREIRGNGQGNGAHFGGLQDVQGELIVIPAVDAGEDHHGSGDRLELRQDDLEEGAHRSAPVNGGGLIQSLGDRGNEVGVQEDAQRQLKGNQDQNNAPILIDAVDLDQHGVQRNQDGQGGTIMMPSTKPLIPMLRRVLRRARG